MGNDLAYRVIHSRDGMIYAVGFARGGVGRTAQGLIIALQSNGTTVWQREYAVGGSGNDMLRGGVIGVDGTLVLVGTASRDADAPFEGWLLRLDRVGTPLNERLFAEPKGGRLNTVASLPDGGILAVGTARGSADVDGWVLQLRGPTDDR
jgi:hypothetical protein